jgi:hypothetical protein
MTPLDSYRATPAHPREPQPAGSKPAASQAPRRQPEQGPQDGGSEYGAPAPGEMATGAGRSTRPEGAGMALGTGR